MMVLPMYAAWLAYLNADATAAPSKIERFFRVKGVNVKLLLSPRQSRGISHYLLKREILEVEREYRDKVYESELGE